MTEYNSWKQGMPPPDGYIVSTYYHCDDCKGHEFLRALPTGTTTKQAEIFPVKKEILNNPFKAVFKD